MSSQDLLKIKLQEVRALVALLRNDGVLKDVTGEPRRFPIKYGCPIEKDQSYLEVQHGHCTTHITFTFDG